MIRKLSVCSGDGFDPHRNLAVEEVLLESVEAGQCILYLWQNENTVVIGKNQNPWKECVPDLLTKEGGTLARRLSGGGAVFHDLGNLNFTFLMRREDEDLDRQLAVIQEAVSSLGIRAERSGRNDVLAQGRKFSGNAFYRTAKQAYHHGTLLVNADMTRLSRYLTPSKAKLQSKGVDSVRSRVVNLRELNPDITVELLKSALRDAFSKVYGLPAEELSLASLDRDRIEALTERNGRWEWLYGRKMPFTMECEERFPWGGVQIQMQIEHGIIQNARIWSDAMDAFLIPELEKRLSGCPFTKDALKARLTGGGSAEDVRNLLLGLCP